MILQIMVYATAVSAALGVAGLCLERLALLQKLPRRTAWIIALLLSILLPLTMILRAPSPSPAPPVPALVSQPAPTIEINSIPRSAGNASTSLQTLAPITRPQHEWKLPRPSDRSLLQAWAFASVLLQLYLIGANLRLRRRIPDWQRLRQTVELDCDARVLRAGAEPETYGEVLLAITGRTARMPSGVVAMSEPVSALERRIQNLLPDPVRHAVLQTVGSIAVLIASVSVAVAATSAAPAARTTDSAQPNPAPLPAAVPDNSGSSRLDKAMRAIAQKYPELLNGPERDAFYNLTMAVTGDGRVIFSNMLSLPGDGLVALGISFDNRIETTIPDTGTGTAKFPKGQPLGGIGKASYNIVARYYMLPADYDEARGIAKVVDAVREKHTDLMLREAALVAPEMFLTTNRRILANGGMLPRPGPIEQLRPNPPAPPPRDTSIVNLLTVFMTEDGRIAREIVEQKRAEELQSIYPLPVDEDTISMYTPPYNSFNPPPVPPEAFKVLGLDAGQIGPTGYVIVHQKGSSERPVPVILPPGVVVRYAWPRRPGEPVGGKAPTSAAP